MIGILADDTTGANDVGIAFHNGGAGVKVQSFDPDDKLVPDADALVIDTNSRFETSSDAYDRVFTATRQLMSSGCTRFYKKTCSALRGNVGSEFAAMLDATESISIIICAAYPANGRSTVNGRHFIKGIPLEDSQFRNDPVHPMTMSDIVDIIALQSSRSSMVIPLDEVRRGPDSLRQVLENGARSHTFLVVDGETSEDIAILAEAAHEFTAFGGSAALGEELASRFGPLQGPTGVDRQALDCSGACVVVCGSLTPQSVEQTERLIASGVEHSVFPSTEIFEPGIREQWINDTVTKGRKVLASGSDFLIHASQDPDVVRATKKLARENACDDAALGRHISSLQAEACARLLENAPPYPVIVAGGDTAAAVCRCMDIKGNRIIEEIDPGVPIGQTLGNPRLIVLKSGGFGKPDFLIRASRRLRSLCSGQP